MVKISAFSVELMKGTPVENYRLPVIIGGAKSPGRWWDCTSLDHRFERILRYTNAPMTVFVPERTVVATGGHFVKSFLLIILVGWLVGKF